MSTSDREPDQTPVPPDQPAVTVETFVREQKGRFEVEIVVVFADGVVRRTVNRYRTRRHAEIAASWIKRGAARDIEGPIHG